MIKDIFLISSLLIFCVGCFQAVPVSGASVVVSCAQANETAPQHDFVGHEKVYRDFVSAHPRHKLGMVIGRGNVHGVAEERITIPALKEHFWLFVDPGGVGLTGCLSGNAQDTSQGNAIATSWPLGFPVDSVFDAVVVDYGAAQFIGNDGEGYRLSHEYYNQQLSLVITLADGTNVSKNSFDYPYKFQGWLIKNRPNEFVRLEAKYFKLIELETRKQIGTLEKGLLGAYLALKKGGVLILPIDGWIERVNLVSLLSISPVDLERRILQNRAELTENPVLPQNNRGVGAPFSDYYYIVRK